MLRWWVGCAVAACGVAAWLLLRGGRARDTAGTVERGATAVAATVAPGAALAEAVSVEPRAEFADALEPAVVELEVDAEEPPTPAAPGPGQALLRVRAVALESGAPLACVRLGLGALDPEDEEHEWHSSRQGDPSRGLENDELLTRNDGCGEFIVETGFGYVLYGLGRNGLAAHTELELGSHAPGEEREVTLALRTRWTQAWVGRVVDGASVLPRVGARVRAGYTEEDPLSDFTASAESRTDSDGRVRLLLPDFDPPIVLAELAGYASGGARVHSKEASEEAPHEFRLHRLAALSVSVLAADGEPCAGVQLDVRQPRWQRIEDAHGKDLVWSLPTDDQGLVTVDGLPSGNRLWVTLARNGQVLARTFDGEETLELGPDEHRRIEWRLPAPAAVRGLLMTSRGEPLAGVKLVLTAANYPFEFLDAELLQHWMPSRSFVLEPRIARTTTDATGAFAFEDLPPGSFELGPAEDEEDLPFVAHPVLLEAGETESLTLTLDRGLWIAGVVLDPDAKPAGFVQVTCASEARAFSKVGASYYSDDDGSFWLGPLVAGEYRVIADDREREFVAASLPLTLAAGTENVVLNLQRGGTLVFEFSGVPEDIEPRVLVRLEAPGSEFSESTAHLAPGTYSLYAWTDAGLVAFVTGFPIEPGRAHVAQLALQPGAHISIAEVESDDGPDQFEFSLDGMPLPSRHWILDAGPGLRAPPGRLRIDGLVWRRDGTLETIATRERDLTTAEPWVVDFEP